ncbi:16S rRNA (cytosine(967)-C(5))-methyltransferase [Halalkalibacillus sediminis]|uniref:16S rRNA (cytosine(967)-C(5))-methyltransferase n=1 Tax=Halalkalibacillus sediminis TaxID=2018042 RepID=A0A2I0QW54_9BACI|nr:16S rRNA (cytosine(967)-C(5))-methyltransferase RsmB [Halalkalibacillus sediminis]PKR78571.1 16S rRNA (cytosine(967)-C(5))-methyltransferase [Halalkalibacillus sediminis]
MSKKNLREVALQLLQQVGEHGGYSHILINQAIQKNDLSNQDKGLLTEIVYGSLQRKLTLQFYLKPFVGNKKLDKWVQWLLYMSVYQMVYLDRVPDHAIINEAVQISKKKGHRGISGFVNGVLRNIQRKGVADFSTIEDPVERLSVETSHPAWMVERWVDQYGYEKTSEMCHSNIIQKQVSVRVQPLKLTRNQAMDILQSEGYEVSEAGLSPQGIHVDTGNVLNSSLFPNQITIQDETSMLVSEMMDLEENMKVLDACSAPGGKATHIAEKMKDSGEVLAYDLHAKKVKLVKDKAETLNLSNIQTNPYDSRKLQEVHSEETFDRILLDAPCSGLGVLRSKPDIKYHKNVSDIEQLSTIQNELLHSVLPLMKKDGKLVYSTCTVDHAENEWQIDKVLKEFPELEVDQSFFDQLPKECQSLDGLSEFGLQIFPQDFQADGFFITRLQWKY